MCDCNRAADAAESTPERPCDSTTAPCMAATIRFIKDSGAADHSGASAISALAISNLKTDDNLPDAHGPSADGAADPDHFKVEIDDTGKGGATIAAGEVTLEALKPDGTSFAPPRRLQVECRRVLGATGDTQNVYRSRYLRLVVDDTDRTENADQCLLADYDPSDESIEILGQLVRATYTASTGDTISAQAPITNEGDRARLRLAAHIVRTSYGVAGSGLVTPAQVATRTAKHYRRVMAQAAVSPTLTQAPAEVDPPRNMLVVSDVLGQPATGNANNMIRFFVRDAPGFDYTVRAGDYFTKIAQIHQHPDWRAIYNHPNNAAFRAARPDPNRINIGDVIFVPATGGRAAVVHFPPAAATPIQTAQALAAIIATGGFTADAVQNARAHGQPAGRQSADLLVRDGAGAMAVLENETSADTTQKVLVARVNANDFRVSSNTVGFSSANIGSAMQRALARNFRTANNTVEAFIVGPINYDDGSTAIRGRAVSPKADGHAFWRPQLPILRTTYMRNDTMDGTDNNPFTFPHESGHVVMDIGHTVAEEQLMGRGTSPLNNAVDVSKRIYDSAVALRPAASGVTVNQVSRVRSHGAPVLGSW